MKIDKLIRHIKYNHKFTQDVRKFKHQQEAKRNPDYIYIEYLKYIIYQLLEQKKNLKIQLKRKLEVKA